MVLWNYNVHNIMQWNLTLLYSILAFLWDQTKRITVRIVIWYSKCNVLKGVHWTYSYQMRKFTLLSFFVILMSNPFAYHPASSVKGSQNHLTASFFETGAVQTLQKSLNPTICGWGGLFQSYFTHPKGFLPFQHF